MSKLKFKAYDKIADVTIPNVSIHHDGYIFFKKEYVKELYKDKDTSHIDNPDMFEHAWLSQDKCFVEVCSYDVNGKAKAYVRLN